MFVIISSLSRSNNKQCFSSWCRSEPEKKLPPDQLPSICIHLGLVLLLPQGRQGCSIGWSCCLSDWSQTGTCSRRWRIATWGFSLSGPEPFADVSLMGWVAALRSSPCRRASCAAPWPDPWVPQRLPCAHFSGSCCRWDRVGWGSLTGSSR